MIVGFPQLQQAVRGRAALMPDSTFAAALQQHGPGRDAAGAWTFAAASDYCRRLAISHYENFPVASWLAPRAVRSHLCHVYAYCRWADDLADETGDARRSRELLAWWEAELEDCYRGQARHPVFVALAATIERFAIPREPFADLLVAFRRDQHPRRYETRAELLDYCRYSANPVGRLVLHLSDAVDEARLRLSDQICTGLQLANFCQDVARDARIGRVYLPQETLRSVGAGELAPEQVPAWRRAVEIETAFADQLLRDGARLVPLMPRSMRAPVWLFVQGGRAIVRAIRRQRYDVFTRRPVVTRWTKFRLLAGAAWRRTCGALGGGGA